jgi:hypothetical protein
MRESLSSFIEKEQSSMGQSQAESMKKLMELFNRLITGNSRDPTEIARDCLMQGQVVQDTLTVSRYVENFPAQASFQIQILFFDD